MPRWENGETGAKVASVPHVNRREIADLAGVSVATVSLQVRHRFASCPTYGTLHPAGRAWRANDLVARSFANSMQLLNALSLPYWSTHRELGLRCTRRAPRRRTRHLPTLREN